MAKGTCMAKDMCHKVTSCLQVFPLHLILNAATAATTRPVHSLKTSLFLPKRKQMMGQEMEFFLRYKLWNEIGETNKVVKRDYRNRHPQALEGPNTSESGGTKLQSLWLSPLSSSSKQSRRERKTRVDQSLLRRQLNSPKFTSLFQMKEPYIITSRLNFRRIAERLE